MKWLPLILLIVGGLILVLKGETESVFGVDEASFAAIVTGLALLIYLGFGTLEDYRGRFANAARDIATWLALALVLVALYAFRNEFAELGRRITGELTPPGGAITVASGKRGSTAVRIRRRPDGHFVARSQVNGAHVTMLVDTGASTLVLKSSDAKRSGINVSKLNYVIPVRTANGVAYAAGVKLHRVAIGPIALANIDALVAKPGVLNESLLGMNFLRRLRSYEFTRDFLTLRG